MLWISALCVKPAWQELKQPCLSPCLTIDTALQAQCLLLAQSMIHTWGISACPEPINIRQLAYEARKAKVACPSTLVKDVHASSTALHL